MNIKKIALYCVILSSLISCSTNTPHSNARDIASKKQGPIEEMANSFMGKSLELKMSISKEGNGTCRGFYTKDSMYDAASIKSFDIDYQTFRNQSLVVTKIDFDHDKSRKHLFWEYNPYTEKWSFNPRQSQFNIVSIFLDYTAKLNGKAVSGQIVCRNDFKNPKLDDQFAAKSMLELMEMNFDVRD